VHSAPPIEEVTMSTFPPPNVPTRSPDPAHTAPDAKWYRRRLWKLPVWAWIAVVVLVIGAIGSSTQKKESGASSGPTTTEETSVATTGKSVATTVAATAEPTTPRPTTTTSTTTTVAPTTTVPAPIVFNGRGDSVVNLPDTSAYVATITHTGRSNFAVWTLDSGLAKTDLLINTIGKYAGRVAVSLRPEATALQIDADGSWSISLLPLLQGSRLVRDSLSGHGDDVLAVVDTAVFTIQHNGSSNFAVWLYNTDGPDLLVNEIGAYSGSVPVRGPAFLVVTADGEWTITKG
jgi:hypothetical protein